MILTVIEIVEKHWTRDDGGKPNPDHWVLTAVRLRQPDDPPPTWDRTYWAEPVLEDGVWAQYRTVHYHSEPDLWSLHNVLPGFTETKTELIGTRIAQLLRDRKADK